MKTLAARIKHIREGLGLTQAEFGRAIGKSRASIHQIENGTTKALKGSTVVAVEKLSGYASEWIESGKGAPKRKSAPLPEGAEDQISRIYSELIKLPPEQRDKIEADIAFLRSLNLPGK